MSKSKTANGLAEVIHYLKELTQDEEYGTYHNELFDALTNAINYLQDGC